SKARSKTMSSIAEYPAAPSWADDKTEVSEIERVIFERGPQRGELSDPGLRTYERLTADIAKAGYLTGPDSELDPHSDVVVGLGQMDSDEGRVVGIGVFIALRGEESFYFDSATARAAAAALLKAADLYDEAVTA